MFGPLNFGEEPTKTSENTKCLLCGEIFDVHNELPKLLSHLFEKHRLIIDDVQKIVKLKSYLSHWRDRFTNVFYATIVPSVTLPSIDGRYYLLSPLMKEDRELRHRLSLENALAIQHLERTDTNYIRDCLFCKLKHEGSRCDYVRHLSEKHNLQLGNPQNLVFVEELVDKLEAMLTELKCVYCEKVFTDRSVLKEHMRKKLHKRINPQNKGFDKYFIVNYLEEDRGWEEVEKDDDNLPVVCGVEPNSDEEYSDWTDDTDQISCLFCRHREAEINTICCHMRRAHNFDFNVATQPLNFYQKIKAVNYVRRQVYRKCCAACGEECGDLDTLNRHMEQEGHAKLPDVHVFDQAEYYFPTYENDAFLYLIDDVEDGSG